MSQNFTFQGVTNFFKCFSNAQDFLVLASAGDVKFYRGYSELRITDLEFDKKKGNMRRV